MIFGREKKILELLESVKIDKKNIICHFQCPKSKKIITAILPFEPYEGKIVLSWKDILFHPLKSYNRYYHTPIIIYGSGYQKTIVIKAFKEVQDVFEWDETNKEYRCRGEM